jgi:hypothetical protein
MQRRSGVGGKNMEKIAMEMIEVRALKPFCGSYKCSLADADVIDETLVERPDGLIVKEKVPRKKFVGLITVERRAFDSELAQIEAGRTPVGLEVISRTKALTMVRTLSDNVRLPSDMAQNLIDRGLAERVEKSKRGAR